MRMHQQNHSAPPDIAGAPAGIVRGDVAASELPFVMEKPFLAFCGAHYYPRGGWGDVVGYFDSVEDALAAMLSGRFDIDWWHVVDIRTGQVVRQKERPEVA